MFDSIPVVEMVGVDETNERVIRTIGYVEQLRDGTLKTFVVCDTVPDNDRIYYSDTCKDCTAYPTLTLALALADELRDVCENVTPALWYSAVGDGMTSAPDMREAVCAALHKYGVDA